MEAQKGGRKASKMKWYREKRTERIFKNYKSEPGGKSHSKSARKAEVWSSSTIC
jgi:zona occludens toxin (predicted ATPase)